MNTNKEKTDFVAIKAAETHNEIKKLNAKLSTAKGKEKLEIENKIKYLKETWWNDVNHLMVKPTLEYTEETKKRISQGWGK